MTEAPEMIGREELASLVEKRGGEFFALFDAETDLEAPNTIGEWSLRDLLAHILAWNEECLWAIRATIEGKYERRDYSPVDVWNAAAVEKLRGVNGAEMLARARETTNRIASSVRQIPEDLWRTKRRVQLWPWNTTIRHYEEHEADIRALSGGDRG